MAKPASRRKGRGRFRDCADCQHLESWRCLRCPAGELFEERVDDLDLDTDTFDLPRSPDRDD